MISSMTQSRWTERGRRVVLTSGRGNGRKNGSGLNCGGPGDLRVSALITLVSILLICLGNLASSAAEHEIISGRPGVASGQAVINLHGMGLFDRLRDPTNHLPRAAHFPAASDHGQSVAQMHSPALKSSSNAIRSE